MDPEDSLPDLETSALEVARLATGFDESGNLDAALYFYKVGPVLDCPMHSLV